MTTPLGHGQPSQFIFHVKNTGSATVAKGQFMKHDFATAITFTETNDPVLAAKRMDANDGVAGEGGVILGVLKEDLPVGATGQVVAFGLAQVVLLLAEAQQTVLVAHSSGVAQDAASASHETPVAINVEATTGAAELAWCFVDCISSMTHVELTTGGDKFHGVAY